jgi:YVTN family beta-propeller protein
MPVSTLIVLTSTLSGEIVCAIMFTRVSVSVPAAFLVAVAVVGCQMPLTDAKMKPGSGVLLVCNKGDHTLGIIDPEAGRQIATIDEAGVTGHEVIASPDGRFAYVPIFGNSGVGKPGTDGSVIRVVDIAARRIVGTVDFGKGVRPHCAMIGPKDKLLYVTAELENAVAVIDPGSLQVIAMIPTGQPESHMLAISRDGKRGYTSNVGPGTVSVLDLEQRKLVTTISVGGKAQRIALSLDDRWIFTADQSKPRLAVIDARSNAVTQWIDLPGIGYGAVATPDGRWLIIAVPGANKVAAIDLAIMEVVHTFDVPRAPQMVVLRPDGAEAYVSCDASRQVVVINVADWKIAKVIEAGPGADGLAWAKSR